jgi:hypothetical protein
MESVERSIETIAEIKYSTVLAIPACIKLIETISCLLQCNPDVALSTTSFSYHLAKSEMLRQTTLLLLCCNADHTGDKAMIATTQMEVVTNRMANFFDLALRLFDLSTESTKVN